jgi:hypothetical protein
MRESQDAIIFEEIKEIIKCLEALQLLASCYQNEIETADKNRQKKRFQKALRKVRHRSQELKIMLTRHGIDLPKMLTLDPDWEVVMAEKRIKYLLYCIAIEEDAEIDSKAAKKAKSFGEWMLS